MVANSGFQVGFADGLMIGWVMDMVGGSGLGWCWICNAIFRNALSPSSVSGGRAPLGPSRIVLNEITPYASFHSWQHQLDDHLHSLPICLRQLHRPSSSHLANNKPPNSPLPLPSTRLQQLCSLTLTDLKLFYHPSHILCIHLDLFRVNRRGFPCCYRR